MGRYIEGHFVYSYSNAFYDFDFSKFWNFIFIFYNYVI